MKEMGKKEMFFEILRNSFHIREDKQIFKNVIAVISDIVDSVKGYELKFKPDEKIWRYLGERFR